MEDNPRLHDGLGQCNHMQNIFDDAILCFDDAVSGDANNAEFKRNRGKCYYDMKKYEES